MPAMDGFQVMEGLREIEGEGYLPVLVITAQPAHKLRALDAGARDFLSKPFDIGELRVRVRNAIEVRLLHTAARENGRALETTLLELRASHEVIWLKTMQEQARLEEESALAQETQESLLPRHMPLFENYRIHAYNSPTRYVGGDFYDFAQPASGGWAGVLADVSGKGMPAALLSSMVLGALNVEFRSGCRPVEILRRINLLLRDKSLPYQYVTMFLFVLNPDGDGQFISAGHNPSWLFRSATGKLERLIARNFVLGMFDEASYESCPLQLGDGDILVVNSDGLTDMANPEGEMFGEEKLLQLIRQEAGGGSEAVERELLQAIREFTQGRPQTDDITFWVVEKLGKRAAVPGMM
jgi:sigma-B regulation protein RsbU (phosphoserine phosphatase)